MTTDSPKESLREKLAQIIAFQWAYDEKEFGATNADRLAAAVATCVVEPELERLTAEVDRLIGRLESSDNLMREFQRVAEAFRSEKASALAEVSRLREQLAAQPPTDLVERAAIWLFRAKTSQMLPDVLQRAFTTWRQALDQRDRDAWTCYAREMLTDLGWGVSSSEVEAPQPQEMTHHKVSVRRYNELWWQAKCPECDFLLYRKTQQEAVDWGEQHEADTLRPQLQANSKLEQNLDEGRPSGSERLAPRSEPTFSVDEMMASGWETAVAQGERDLLLKMAGELLEQCTDWDDEYGACAESVPDPACRIRAIVNRYAIQPDAAQAARSEATQLVEELGAVVEAPSPSLRKEGGDQ